MPAFLGITYILFLRSLFFHFQATCNILNILYVIFMFSSCFSSLITFQDVITTARNNSVNFTRIRLECRRTCFRRCQLRSVEQDVFYSLFLFVRCFPSYLYPNTTLEVHLKSRRVAIIKNYRHQELMFSIKQSRVILFFKLSTHFLIQ